MSFIIFRQILHFQETVKEKEQSLRKYEQEVDSLTFRNQQLFTRCEVLQNELSTLESQKKKNKVVFFVFFLIMFSLTHTSFSHSFNKTAVYK